MTTVIAVKRIHRTKAGQTMNLPDAQARALVSLGLAYYPPQMAKVKVPVATVPKTVVQAAPSTYMRRDLTAEQPQAVPAMTTKPSNG